MTITDPSLPDTLTLAHCAACGSYTFPSNVYACRCCGAPREKLQSRPCPQEPRLRSAVTLHAQLHPDLPAPCVIGEVELAPGVVEEAVLDLTDESAAVLGMPLKPIAIRQDDGAVRWRFASLAQKECQ